MDRIKSMMLHGILVWKGLRYCNQWRTEGGCLGGGGSNPPRHCNVLAKRGRVPRCGVHTSRTPSEEYGFHSFADWAEPVTRGLLPPDPHSLCPLSSPAFVEPPPPNKIPGYVTDYHNMHIILSELCFSFAITLYIWMQEKIINCSHKLLLMLF
jgi:hypothetical protein